VAELLVADSLRKTYGEGTAATQALKGVSFTLDEGEFAAIIGQSGSGKSTLLNLLGLLDTPTSGRVIYHGSDVGGLETDARADLRNELLGFVFQFHYLLPEFSVAENVAMPAAIGAGADDTPVRERAMAILEQLGLVGLEDKNANELSGGQKQRVAIARALMNEPSLVLADEPTGNLDTTNTDVVYDLFRKISTETGTAFLIVTHDRGVAQRADRIIEVTDGLIVQDVANAYMGSTPTASPPFG
jgi:lipoprotein-releasing system ATP-binding protein